MLSEASYRSLQHEQTFQPQDYLNLTGRQEPLYLNIRHQLIQRPTKNYFSMRHIIHKRTLFSYSSNTWILPDTTINLLLINLNESLYKTSYKSASLFKFKLMVTWFCPVWKLSCCHYLLCLPIHFLVIIFRYSSAFCAALAWASFDDVPLP
jgi:hypothetical protein